ncbi:butyrophilin subfamily 3 member A2-like [Xyrichtys novacula]|uniref:Butyrophilin subfamily 3 member A2-like n=1 Tax=Xyrichtys novacula TaxID=13765 RepID=A0AAV1EHQ1_XYRNO|nr:butyrophilin subfamily 3 member A2-like [Xyrichtys novacula]
MCLLKDGSSSTPQRGSFSTLVFLLVLIHTCADQSLLTPSQPAVATVGEDIILPCHLDPAVDASDLTVEWRRPDLNPRFVYVWRDGLELESKKHPSYIGRTSVSIRNLKHGDVSLKLKGVQLFDEGTYGCFIPMLNREVPVKLLVGAASSLVISSRRSENNEVVLQCESEGWYPEPEVLWLDSVGNLLSDGPTETIRGPDGLYNVSSKVTVEKRDRNIFTCRVQQKNLNLTRETHVHVPEDFFKTQPSSVSTIILSVMVAVMAITTAVACWALYRRQNQKWDRKHSLTNTKRSSNDDTELHALTEEERETLPDSAESRTIGLLDERRVSEELDEKICEHRFLVDTVVLLMNYRADLVEQKIDMEKKLREAENQTQEETLTDGGTQTERTDMNSEGKNETDPKTKVESLKKELQEKETILTLILQEVDNLTKRKESVYRQINDIYSQREDEKEKGNETYAELTLSSSDA